MPLVRLSGQDAVANRKSNPHATWGKRDSANRVEPIASPHFALPFSLDRGSNIFTVGSCFARNVETKLAERGYRLPMRELFTRPEFAGVEVAALNNFGTPSIWNEFAWAMGEQEFVPEHHIVEAGRGKYTDLHVISSVRPDERDIVMARRAAIHEAYRSFRECSLVIMTRGLTEIWFDTASGTYINAAPLPSLMRAAPERFELHVLSYKETFDFLDRTVDLIFRHGRPDLNMLLTVSPVPLTSTHRPMDVMVANAYSKSALRTAAEEIVSKYARVSYFPSYESVTLSDRKMAWADDFTHVTEAIVTLNVSRLVDLMAGAEWDAVGVRAAIEAGGADVAVEFARRARETSDEAASAFFAEHGGLASRSPDLAAEYAEFLHHMGKRVEAAEVAIPHAREGNERLTLMAAQYLTQLRRPGEAFELLSVLTGSRSNAYWTAMMRAACDLGDEARVRDIMRRWSQALPKRTGRAYAMAGRWFLDSGDPATAKELLDQAAQHAGDDAYVHIVRGEVYLGAGDAGMAREIAASIEPRLGGERIMLERLNTKLRGVG